MSTRDSNFDEMPDRNCLPEDGPIADLVDSSARRAQIEYAALKCDACGKEDHATRVKFSYSTYDSGMMRFPGGWFVSARINHGYEHGDEVIDIDDGGSFCSTECFVRGKNEARERALRELEEQKKRLAEQKEKQKSTAMEMVDRLIIHAYGREAYELIMALKVKKEALEAEKK